MKDQGGGESGGDGGPNMARGMMEGDGGAGMARGTTKTVARQESAAGRHKVEVN